jgi:probable rRNA maturation factor
MTAHPEAGDSGLELIIAIDDDGWAENLPEYEALARRWVEAAIAAARADGGAPAGPLSPKAAHEMGVVFSSDEIVQALNREWRNKDQPTNVLAFADAEPPPAGAPWQMGDVVLAFGTTQREAESGGLTIEAHAAHLGVHGILHLFGYDHMDDEEAQRMERLETRVLAGLGIADPYDPAARGPRPE